MPPLVECDACPQYNSTAGCEEKQIHNQDQQLLRSKLTHIQPLTDDNLETRRRKQEDVSKMTFKRGTDGEVAARPSEKQHRTSWREEEVREEEPLLRTGFHLLAVTQLFPRSHENK